MIDHILHLEAKFASNYLIGEKTEHQSVLNWCQCRQYFTKPNVFLQVLWVTTTLFLRSMLFNQCTDFKSV